MRKIDRKKKKKKKKKKRRRKKITVEIVATNVVASRPPNGDRLQRRPLVPTYRSLQEYIKIISAVLQDFLTTKLPQD